MGMTDFSKHVGLNTLEALAHLALGGTVIDSWNRSYYWNDEKGNFFEKDPISDRPVKMNVDAFFEKGLYRKPEDDIYSHETLLELVRDKELTGSSIFACLALGGTLVDSQNRECRWSEKKEAIVWTSEYGEDRVSRTMGVFFADTYRRKDDVVMVDGYEPHVNVSCKGSMYVAVTGQYLLELLAKGVTLYSFNREKSEVTSIFFMMDGILFVRDVKSGETEPSPIYVNELRDYQLHYKKGMLKKESGALPSGDVTLEDYEPMDATEILASLGAVSSFITSDGKTFSEEEMGNLTLKEVMTTEWMKPKPFILQRALLKTPDRWVAEGRWQGNPYKIGFDSNAMKVVISPIKEDTLPVSGEEGVIDIILAHREFTDLGPLKEEGLGLIKEGDQV